jgi:ornithine cyclodeaminase/alanine dehydrogenase
MVTGKKPAREREEERTFAVNLGLAMEDMAVAPLVFQRAIEMNIGTRLPL